MASCLISICFGRSTTSSMKRLPLCACCIRLHTSEHVLPCLAIDPEFIDVEHHELPTFHEDWDAFAGEILGLNKAVLEVKAEWLNQYKPLAATEMREDSALENAKRLPAFQ